VRFNQHFPKYGKKPQADATAELAASFEGSPAKEDVTHLAHEKRVAPFS